MGFEVAGYPTARPQELARVTAGLETFLVFPKRRSLMLLPQAQIHQAPKSASFERLSSEMDGVEIPSPYFY